MLKKRMAAWRDFAAQAAARDEITVLDGTLQHLLNTLLAINNTPSAQISACLGEILDCIAPLQPTLIYLHPGELASGLRAMFDARSAEWEAGMTSFIENSAFGMASGLHGFEAACRYYEAFSGLLDETAQRWPGRCLKLESSVSGWTERRAALLDFLNIAPEEAQAIPFSEAYVGTYQDTDETRTVDGRECNIQVENGLLYIYDLRYPRGQLIPLAAKRFQVETVGYTLDFAAYPDETIRYFTVSGKEPAIPIPGFTLLGRTYRKI